MSTLIGKLSPSITNLIRIDHAHVLSTFRQFHAGTSAPKKQALVSSACLALELHADVEEEVFYPALREIASDVAVVEKSFPEHAEMRRLIAKLRGLPPADAQYDSTFMELMRDVMHHVADEETTLLPAAERLLPQRLGELGAEMSRRRMQQLTTRAGELAALSARTFPESAFVATSGLLAAGATLFGRSGVR